MSGSGSSGYDYIGQPRAYVAAAKRKVYLTCGQFRMIEPNGSDSAPSVCMTSEQVTVGCTTATREVIERLYALFQVKYPKGACAETKIQ